MNPMETAPKDGRVIRLHHADHCSVSMAWDDKLGLWTGLRFGLIGSVRTYWDETISAPQGWTEVPA